MMFDNEAFISGILTFWDRLSEQERRLILNDAVCVKYKQGKNIHSGEKDCVGVLLLKSGELRTYMLSEEGREITLYRMGAGDVCILSSSCILSNITFDVNIDAERDSEAVLINPAVFKQICNQNIYAENFSNKVAVDKFSDVMWAMQQILFMSFDRRLAIFLLDEMSKSDSEDISLTHEQIAKYIGSAREVVSRMLKYFQNEGLVELSRGGVRIVDKAGLRKLI